MAPGDYVQWNEQKSGRVTRESGDYLYVKTNAGRGPPNKVHKAKVATPAAATTGQKLTVWGLVVAAVGLALQALGVKVFSWLWDFVLRLL